MTHHHGSSSSPSSSPVVLAIISGHHHLGPSSCWVATLGPLDASVGTFPFVKPPPHGHVKRYRGRGIRHVAIPWVLPLRIFPLVLQCVKSYLQEYSEGKRGVWAIGRLRFQCSARRQTPTSSGTKEYILQDRFMFTACLFRDIARQFMLKADLFLKWGLRTIIWTNIGFAGTARSDGSRSGTRGAAAPKTYDVWYFLHAPKSR